MAIGDVKDLIVRFFAKDWEAVKAKIDSIPDEKTVKIDFDISSASGAKLAALASLMREVRLAAREDARAAQREMTLVDEFIAMRRRIRAESDMFDLLNPDKGGGGFLSKLFGSGFGRIGPVPSFFTSLPGLAVAVGAIGTALNEVVALASGFAAAGAGAVAFGLLARPTFAAVSGALTKLATDTAAYQSATTAAAKSDALAKIKADWAALDPAQKQAVRQVQAFQASWAEAAQKFEPQVMKIFNDVLSIANHILPALSQLATPFANALDPLLKKLDTFVQSKGFHDWLKQFASLVGPATTAIGNGLGRMVSDLGKLLTIFSGKDAAHAINIAFDIIDGAIRGVTAAVKWLKGEWDAFTQHDIPALEHAFDNFQHALGNVRHAWDNVSHAIDNFRHAMDNIGHAFGNIIHAIDNVIHAWGNFNHAIDNARHFVAVAVHDIWNVITTILNPGKLAAFLISSGRAIISGLIAGIRSMMGPLGSVMSAIGGIIGHFLPNSPEAKMGPLSGYGGLENRGRAISEFLAKGITAGGPAVNAAMLGVTRGIAGPHGAGVRYGGAGGGGITINIYASPLTSPNDVARAVQKGLLQLKRNNGGAALGLA